MRTFGIYVSLFVLTIAISAAMGYVKVGYRFTDTTPPEVQYVVVPGQPVDPTNCPECESCDDLQAKLDRWNDWYERIKTYCAKRGVELTKEGAKEIQKNPVADVSEDVEESEDHSMHNSRRRFFRNRQ